MPSFSYPDRTRREAGGWITKDVDERKLNVPAVGDTLEVIEVCSTCLPF